MVADNYPGTNSVIENQSAGFKVTYIRYTYHINMCHLNSFILLLVMEKSVKIKGPGGGDRHVSLLHYKSATAYVYGISCFIREIYFSNFDFFFYNLIFSLILQKSIVLSRGIGIISDLNCVTNARRL